MKLSSFFLPVLGVLTVATILAQPPKPLSDEKGPSALSEPESVAPTAENRVGPLILSEVKHDVSPPLRDMEPLDSEEGSPRMLLQTRPQHPGSGQSTTLHLADAVLQNTVGLLVGTTSGLNFDGLSATTWAEPDSNGAVGATQFLQWVNVSFAVYDKTTGALVHGPVAGNTLWSGFGGPCQTGNSGDPIAQYDKAAGRWVMTQHAVSKSAYYQCVAVSTTSDATGTYNRYAFLLPKDFPDYPKLGVWPDAYYLSINLGTPHKFSFVGPLLCALNRSAMLTGATATAQCFQLGLSFSSLLPSDLDGSTPPPTGSPNYFVALGTNSLNLWKFHVDFTTPANSTVSGPTSIAVAAFTKACNGGVCIPQTGTSQVLDSLGDRLMYRLAYRNFGSHESLVVNHSVVAGKSVGVRWYEIQNPGGTPVVFQQGTYAPDSNYRWMGSVAMDKVGDIAAGYSVSSSSMHPAISYTGRVPTDALGTLEAEASIIAGLGSETSSGRWGDYSSISVDPVDDCTFWYTNEYLKTSGSTNWKTRIASFKFTTCQ